LPVELLAILCYTVVNENDSQLEVKMQLLRDAWRTADTPTRITMIVGVAALIGLALWQGADLSWLPKLLMVGG
jgi:hypothetical protein